MDGIISRQRYIERLQENLSTICFDRSSGEQIELRDVFYPLKIDEGKYAFQSFAKQMNKAERKAAEVNASRRYRVPSTAQSIEKKRQISMIKANIRLALENSGNDREATMLDDTNDQEDLSDIKISKLPSALETDNQTGTDVQLNNKALSDAIVEHTNQLLHEMEAASGNQKKMSSETVAVNYIYSDQTCKASALMLSNPSEKSRFLAIASAGHGKSTILRRIALLYCDLFNGKNSGNSEIQEYYSLSGTYIPCIIRLRSIADTDSVEKAIFDSVKNVINDLLLNEDDSKINEFIDSLQDEILLLIDGLDELSDKTRYKFLLELEAYLMKHRSTPVIMTSRVAGLSETGVMDVLQRMEFHGRSIIPLTTGDAENYAQEWIRFTQTKLSEEEKSILNQEFSQFLTDDRYKNQRELIRTPLELVSILKQLVNNNLASNRFRMFHDMLWEMFTNHEKRLSKKQLVFDDTMALLALVAYQMQVKDQLFIDSIDFPELLIRVQKQSFHTDLLRVDSVTGIINFLDVLAANVGIIERDDRTEGQIYAFPIRSYQEYLTAYACCHLRLNENKTRPDPCDEAKRHMEDSKWTNIITFILSDLQVNDKSDFETLVSILFSSIQDLDRLKELVESDISVTKELACVLCENALKNKVLIGKQKELLSACMETKSASAYSLALKSLYREADEAEKYLEANATATVLRDFLSGESTVAKVMKLLLSSDPKDVDLAAAMITMMMNTLMNTLKDDANPQYTAHIKRDFIITDEMIYHLAQNALMLKDIYCVEALTHIWLSGLKGSNRVKKVLTKDLAQIVLQVIEQSAPVYKKVCTECNDIQLSNEYVEAMRLVYILGSFPRNTDLANHKGGNIYVSSFIQAVYELSKDDIDMDQTAIAVAAWYYCWNSELFIEHWVNDICKGMPLEYVRKDHLSIRERNHFELLRKDKAISSASSSYLELQTYNTFIDDTDETVFDYFRAGKYREGALFCLRTRGKIPSSNSTNLAFLMRYGHVDPNSLGTFGRNITVPLLLENGVKENECYALMNMFLYQLEQKNYSEASKLLERINDEDLERVTQTFWYPELWKAKDDPEGALVSVIAQNRGCCSFDDYKEMIKCVKKTYSGLKITGIIKSGI